MKTLTPEEAEAFMYKLCLRDYFEGKVLIGEGEKEEIKKYEGRVISKHLGLGEPGHFFIQDGNKGYSPQVIFPKSILEYEITDSPLTEKFGSK